ncbi:unnamed protein product [Staurois parvus]|uniref:Uncharacterized protein n=1 Tax=Staurois parvus TaxID=386267 RepID=A0ABN9DBL6_9NEOB|nr:unnamed protein product [Staurois parvus]
MCTQPTPPFMAVNHRVPAGDYSLAPGDCRASLTGRRTVCKQNSSSPSARAHCFGWLCIAQPCKAV